MDPDSRLPKRAWCTGVWDKNCSDKPDGNLDGTAEMMILQTSTESGHPIFRASSAFERGELDSREHGNKSSQFNDDERIMEMLLRTVVFVNQLSIYGALVDLCKESDKISSEDSAEDSSEDSESSGTRHAKEFLEMRRLNREFFMWCLKTRCLLVRNAAISETDTSRTSKTSTTKSAIRTSRKLRLLCRSENWRYYRELRGNPQASSSSTSHWPTSQWQTSWSSWQPTSSEKWWWISVSWRQNFQKIYRRCSEDTHSEYTSVQCSVFTSAERKRRAWLK